MLIVLSGGLVRVTGSGLGCPDWPTCAQGRIVPAAEAAAGWHQAIEFGNRLMTFVVLAVAAAAFLQARRIPGRPDLTRLAGLLPAGVLAQALLGGLTVLTELNPLIVAGHLLASMGLIAAATVLHHRTTPPAPSPQPGRWLGRLGTTTTLAAAAVLALGTLVTAAGPHAGDPGTPRLALPVADLARVHAGAVWATVALTGTALLIAVRTQHRPATHACGWLLAVELAQATVGYTQYALGVPEGLVLVHLLLACIFWIAAVRVGLHTATAPRPHHRATADGCTQPPTISFTN